MGRVLGAPATARYVARLAARWAERRFQTGECSKAGGTEGLSLVATAQTPQGEDQVQDGIAKAAEYL
jgi:hypothetical protein